MRLLFTLASIVFTISGYAQKFTVSGFIKDASSGQSLIGATVINTKTISGSSANTQGFYSLTQKRDSVLLVFSYVGYQRQLIRFLLLKDTTINVNLNDATELEEVVVSASKTDDIHEANQMSAISISVDQIKSLPALLGEVDVLKIIQLMPGVKSSEGSTGLYVRGGGADQNLILLDGVPVYNASHLFGFFSVFNADAINRVDLIKGGFPARYGGRLSSVIDINLKDGNMKEVHGEASVGIVAAKATIEGPIKKDKTSFIFSARRTYIDVLAKPIIKKVSEGDENVGYFFYDLNGKVNHIINKKNRIYLSAYMGDDKAYEKFEYEYDRGNAHTLEKDNSGLRWGNIITAFRWNSVINPKLFSNVATTFSRYKFNVSSEYEVTTTPSNAGENKFSKNEYISGIRDWAAKIDFDYLPDPNHYIRFGANAIWHKFSPGVYTYRSDVEQDTTLGAKRINANELAIYIEDDIKISDHLKINIGGHASSFYVEGKWYNTFQPRISARYLLSDDFSLKASFASMTQFIHLLTNAGLGLPTDLWVPSTAKVKPQQANQVALGLAKTYRSKYEFSLEAYYKKMSNLIEYKDGASFVNVETDWQDNIAINGKGESYGAELLLQKKNGKLTGWIGYTLSWTNRQFDDLNFGKWFPYKYDRRHDVSVALTHTWNKRMDFSMVWVYGTGNAVTLPTSQYPDNSHGSNTYYGGSELNYYGARNDFRMRSYHRLDISFSFWKTRKWGQSKWTVGVYNAYSRRNPFFMQLGYDKDGNKKFIQYSLFPIIPAITYSIKF